MCNSLKERNYVDKNNKIELQGMNATIYFLKQESDSNALKKVENLLIDAYENRICQV